MQKRQDVWNGEKVFWTEFQFHLTKNFWGKKHTSIQFTQSNIKKRTEQKYFRTITRMFDSAWIFEKSHWKIRLLKIYMPNKSKRKKMKEKVTYFGSYFCDCYYRQLNDILTFCQVICCFFRDEMHTRTHCAKDLRT